MKEKAQFETRTFPVSELRASTDADGKGKIAGHAAMFNSMSEDLGGFREVISIGAFAKTLESADVRCLWNHDTNIVLGRNKSGTLRLHEDDRGLAFELDPPDTQLVRDMVLSPISRGDVSQCSFRFETVTDKWELQGGEWIRTLVEVNISEVSPVTFPAYTSTDIALRSLDAAIKTAVPDQSYLHGIRMKKLALAG